MIGLLFGSCNVGDLRAGQESKMTSYAPRGERRLIVCHDPAQAWASTIPAKNEIAADWLKDPESWKTSVQTIMRAHAEAGVDTFVHCLFVWFATNTAPGVSKVDEPIYNVIPFMDCLKDMNEAGHDLVRIFLDQAHEEGMTFIAGLRMNDRHGAAANARVYREHPQWHAQGVPRGLDYAHQGFRDMMVTYVNDLLDHYDVDGVELDWMRWVFMFSVGEERDNAHLLTDFHRRIRTCLDDAGKKRGRRLLLGVRVPDVLEECELFGFDVEQWIREGLVDYVVPAHFGYMDFSANIEKYRKLTEGTDCRVYPSLNLWAGPSRIEHALGKNAFQPEHYYAAAHNYYAFGADGISTFNYLPISDVTVQTMVPRLMNLAPITDPTTLAKHQRDFLFWRRSVGEPNPNNPAGGIRYDVIILDRSVAGARGTFAFRLAEDLTKQDVSAVMEFKVVGMNEEDVVAVQLNGKVVSPEILNRFFIWDGTNSEGEHEPYHLYRLRLEPQLIEFGDNELAIGLTKAADRDGAIRIEEVNVKVRPR